MRNIMTSTGKSKRNRNGATSVQTPLHYRSIDFIAHAGLLMPKRGRVPVTLRVPMPWLEDGLPDSLMLSARLASDEHDLAAFRAGIFDLEICGIKVRVRRSGYPTGVSWHSLKIADVFGALYRAMAEEEAAGTKVLREMGVEIDQADDEPHQRPANRHA